MKVNKEDGTVTIPIAVYNNLLEAEATYNALSSGGVQDWAWFEASMEDNYVEPDYVK